MTVSDPRQAAIGQSRTLLGRDWPQMKMMLVSIYPHLNRSLMFREHRPGPDMLSGGACPRSLGTGMTAIHPDRGPPPASLNSITVVNCKHLLCLVSVTGHQPECDVMLLRVGESQNCIHVGGRCVVLQWRDESRGGVVNCYDCLRIKIISG